MKGVESELKLRELLFDKIRFERIGEKNENKLQEDFTAQIGKSETEDLYRVVLSLQFRKESEYEGEIVLHGIFSFSGDSGLDQNTQDVMIRDNTVAIMMPYVRSELTLLTSQPGVDAVVLPPFNINSMLRDKNK